MVTNYAIPSDVMEMKIENDLDIEYWEPDGRIYELEQEEKILNLIKQKYPSIYYECLEECAEYDRMCFEAND